MAGDLYCWPCACVFVLCEHMAFVLVFCVPCALMSIVLTPPILFPDYWLICPTCLSSLHSSFAPFIISLCLQSCVSLSLYLPWLCPALPSLVASCLGFPLRGSFGFFCLFFVNKSPSLCTTESSPHPFTPTLTLSAVGAETTPTRGKALAFHLSCGWKVLLCEQIIIEITCLMSQTY